MSLGPAAGELNALDEADLRPFVASPAPEPDVNITLNLVVVSISERSIRRASRLRVNVDCWKGPMERQQRQLPRS